MSDLRPERAHRICAGRGDDEIRGAGSGDDIYGNGGSDFLQGGKGRDSLHGGRGTTCYGEGHRAIAAEVAQVRTS